MCERMLRDRELRKTEWFVCLMIPDHYSLNTTPMYVRSSVFFSVLALVRCTS